MRVACLRQSLAIENNLTHLLGDDRAEPGPYALKITHHLSADLSERKERGAPKILKYHLFFWRPPPSITHYTSHSLHKHDLDSLTK